MCFTETNNNGTNFRDIDNYGNNWKSVHRFFGHGLSICYQTAKISVVEEFHIMSPIEMLPVLFKSGNIHVLIVLIYRPPGTIGTFINLLTSPLSSNNCPGRF